MAPRKGQKTSQEEFSNGHLSVRGNGAVKFDVDTSRIGLTTKQIITMVSFAVMIGGGIFGVHYRLGGLDQTVTSLREELPDRIEKAVMSVSQAEDRKRRLECLEAQIANSKTGWVCPKSVATIKDEPVIVGKAPRAKSRKESSSVAWPFQLFGIAQAKPIQ